MWSAEPTEEGDALRQGDLLVDVLFPTLKQPLEPVHLGTEGILVETKRKAGLVVSQCCDNVTGDYLAVAPIQPRGGMTPDQAAALRSTDPSGADGYTFGAFQLDPIEGVLEQKRDDRPWVAELERTAAFWGDCTVLQENRVARMAPEGRRLLRIKLALLWGRVEEEDAVYLEANGLPPGLEA